LSFSTVGKQKTDAKHPSQYAKQNVSEGQLNLAAVITEKHLAVTWCEGEAARGGAVG